MGEQSIHEIIAASHPSLTRGQVWCRSCGHTQKVNTPGALQHGWPKCCGFTMTIDSPEEQQALAAARIIRLSEEAMGPRA